MTTINRYKKSVDLRSYQPGRISLVFDDYYHTDTIYLNSTCIKIPTCQFNFSDLIDYRYHSADKFIVTCPHLIPLTDKDYIAIKQICSIVGVELSTLLDTPDFNQTFTYIYANQIFLPIVKQVFGKNVYLKPENKNHRSVIKAVRLNDCGLIKSIYLNNGKNITFKSDDDSTYYGNFRSLAADIDTTDMYERYYKDLKFFRVFPPSEEDVLSLVNSHIDDALSSLANEKFYGYPQSSEIDWYLHKCIDLPRGVEKVEFLLLIFVISLVTIVCSLYGKKRILGRLNKRLEYVFDNYPKYSAHLNLPNRYHDFDIVNDVEELLFRSDEVWKEKEDFLLLQERQKTEADEIKRRFPNGYRIICEGSNGLSNIEIIEKADLIKYEDDKYRHELMDTYTKTSKELNNIDNSVSHSLKFAKYALSQGDIEEAKLTVEKSKAILCRRKEILVKHLQIADTIKTVTSENVPIADRSEELQGIITDIDKSIEVAYTKGVPVVRDVLYVKYKCEDSFLKQNGHDWTYPCVRFPSYGCVVFPHRRRKIARRGYMEARFEEMLREHFASDLLDVIGDANILLTDGCRPYEPDIAIVEKGEKYNLRIDIEIDEPYAGLTRQATHYIGCGDYTRDMNLTSAGWIVVRFNEEAIVKNHEACLSYIAQIIEEAIPSYKRPEHLRCNHLIYKRWSEIEAKIMAANKYRESYLGVQSFGDIENGPLQCVDIIQNETEKRALKEIKAHFVSDTKPKNLDKSTISFDNDNRLVFEPSEHTYIYDGTIELRAVSNIISLFFEQFDAVRHAVRMGLNNGVYADYYLELWDRKGCLSREVGTFMHQQINNIINGKRYKNNYQFKYKAEVENVDIQKEIDFFLSFMRNAAIQPFRTEWAICDREYRIAGTIDCICRNGDTYEIYDWKRSSKVVDYSGAPILQNDWGHKGYKPINHINDTSFWKYALQQNIYKFILEKNYGIKVSAMKILVLHADYCKPYLLDIPTLKEEVIQMLEIIKNKSF